MLLTVSPVIASGSAFKVTYVSAEHIYINGGTEDGLAVGDTLTFIGKNRDTVLVELAYTAGHSASGIIVSGAGLPVVGDLLLASTKVGTETPIEPEPIIVSQPPEDIPKEIVQEEPFKDETVPPTELKGTISFGVYHWSDQSPANLDFTQTNTRMNLKVHRLWDEHLTLAIREGSLEFCNKAIESADMDCQYIVVTIFYLCPQHVPQ